MGRRQFMPALGTQNAATAPSLDQRESILEDEREKRLKAELERQKADQAAATQKEKLAQVEAGEKNARLASEGRRNKAGGKDVSRDQRRAIETQEANTQKAVKNRKAGKGAKGSGDAGKYVAGAQAIQAVTSDGGGGGEAPKGQSTAEGAMSGAASGAAMGASLSGGNPYATAAGGIIGGVKGIMSAKSSRKAAKRAAVAQSYRAKAKIHEETGRQMNAGLANIISSLRGIA